MALGRAKYYLELPYAGACSITGELDLLVIGSSLEFGHCVGIASMIALGHCVGIGCTFAFGQAPDWGGVWG